MKRINLGSLIKLKPRRSLQHISMDGLINLRTDLLQENKKLWKQIIDNNVKPKHNKEERKAIKNAYRTIVKNEATLIKIKIVQQQLNLGLKLLKEKELEQTNFVNIFKLGEYKSRRDFLIDVPTVSEKERKTHSEVLSRKFINKELMHMTKLIDKTSYKMNQFNREITINTDDLGVDVQDALLRLAA